MAFYHWLGPAMKGWQTGKNEKEEREMESTLKKIKMQQLLDSMAADKTRLGWEGEGFGQKKKSWAAEDAKNTYLADYYGDGGAARKKDANDIENQLLELTIKKNEVDRIPTLNKQHDDKYEVDLGISNENLKQERVDSKYAERKILSEIGENNRTHTGSGSGRGGSGAAIGYSKLDPEGKARVDRYIRLQNAYETQGAEGVEKFAPEIYKKYFAPGKKGSWWSGIESTPDEFDGNAMLEQERPVEMDATRNGADPVNEALQTIASVAQDKQRLQGQLPANAGRTKAVQPPAASPMKPAQIGAQAQAALLSTMGVPPQQIAQTIESQEAQMRTRLLEWQQKFMKQGYPPQQAWELALRAINNKNTPMSPDKPSFMNNKGW